MKSHKSLKSMCKLIGKEKLSEMTIAISSININLYNVNVVQVNK